MALFQVRVEGEEEMAIVYATSGMNAARAGAVALLGDRNGALMEVKALEDEQSVDSWRLRVKRFGVRRRA